MVRPKKSSQTTAANLGFEATLWAAADKLRNNMDAAEYKHVVLGLISLKYLSDAFEELHTKLSTDPGSDPEDFDEYGGDAGAGMYEDIPGFCKISTRDEIRKHGYVLIPGRSFGAEDTLDDGEPFSEKMDRLITLLSERWQRVSGWI